MTTIAQHVDLFARIPRDPEVTSRIMRSVRSKNTVPEVTLRRAVHARGDVCVSCGYAGHADVAGAVNILRAGPGWPVRSRKAA